MKKKKINELTRVQNVLENDRLNVGKGFNELLANDLNKLFKDYFDFSGLPELKIDKENGVYRVIVSLNVSRVRAFNILPDEK
ncbi:MAG: hypothetical protein IJX03_01205 [Clostridia bacterium]|nr:hypothetical protein [Clostridia bacterium]